MPLWSKEDENTERGPCWWSITLLLIWERTALIKWRKCGAEEVPRPNGAQSDGALKEQLLMGLRWMSPAVDKGVIEMSSPSTHCIRSDTSVRLHVTAHSAHGRLLWQHNKKISSTYTETWKYLLCVGGGVWVCECASEYLFELFIWTVLNPALWKTF